MKKNITMTRQRDLDFYRACCRELDRARSENRAYPTVRRLVRDTLRQPAPQFYVCYDTALRRIYGMRKGNISLIYSSKQRMWAEMDAMTSQMQQRHSLCLAKAVARVLSDCHAPRFYITQSVGEKIFRNCRADERRHKVTVLAGRRPARQPFPTDRRSINPLQP